MSLVPECLERHGYSVLDLCETLHVSKTGSGDHLGGKELARAMSALTNRLVNWQDYGSSTRAYDNAVRQLITETLKEQLHNIPQDDKVIE